MIAEDLNDALAMVREWDGGSIEEKLAAFGLDAAEVRDIVQERWEAYHPGVTREQMRRRAEGPDEMFVRAWLEALLTGLMVERREAHDRRQED